jgi:hypothetical protein
MFEQHETPEEQIGQEHKQLDFLTTKEKRVDRTDLSVSNSQRESRDCLCT